MVIGIPSVYTNSIMILLVGIMKSFDKSFFYSEKNVEKTMRFFCCRLYYVILPKIPVTNIAFTFKAA